MCGSSPWEERFWSRETRIPMDFRTLAGTVFLVAFLVAPAAMAQGEPAVSVAALAATVATGASNANPAPLVSLAPPVGPRKPFSPSRAAKTRFILMSACVYGASLADMHGTLELRHYSWWRETDPLARPFARLPAPAYYAGGLAVATGVNWLSWRMARSKRWHKLASIPQLISISGNGYGISTGLH